MKKNAIFIISGLGYTATAFVWPVLLFLSAIKLVAMGAFYLLSNTINAGIMYFAGKKTDKKKSKRIAQIGAIGHALSMILRAVSTTLLFMATFQTMGGFFGGLLHISIDSSFFKHSHRNIGNAIMNREFYMHIGRIFSILTLFLALAFFEIKQALIFILIFSGCITATISFIIKKDYILSD